MPTVQFGGIVSGLSTKDIIDALMAAERQPLLRLQNRRTDLEARRTAFGRLSTALTDLLTKSKAFTVSQAGASRTATSATPAVLTATAAAGALVGQYQVSVDRLATSTKATSTASIGTAVTDASATGTMASLPLPGSITAGTSSAIVNGTIVSVTVGDPSTTSLKATADALAAAIQAQIRTTDGAATVTASVVNNKIELSMTGAAASHAVRFSAGGDTSNFLGITGLAGLSAVAFANGTPITGSSALGVVRTTGALDAAGLTGLTSTATGSLTINGAAIAYDTTVDSLSTLTSRINASAAGVTASLDRGNDRIVLTNRTAGATAISIADTVGTLGAALRLAPGTTTAQAFGQTAQVTVDGRVVTGDSNRITNAIDGVGLDLLALSAGTVTITVGPDRVATRKSVADLVASFNALADQLDSLTANAVGKPRGALASEGTVRGLLVDLRTTIMSTASGLPSGAIRSLGDIGVSSGVIGAAVGATRRLSLDETKLDRAIDSDPTRVAQLLNGVGGAIAPLVSRLTNLTGASGPVGSATDGIASALRALAGREPDLERRLAIRQAAIERRYAALEKSLSLLQSTSAQLGAQLTTSRG